MLITSAPQYIQGLTNAKLDLTGTGVTTLYTSPSTVSFSVVNSILVSEDSGNADTITLTLTNGTVELLTRDLVLQTGEILKATAATGNRLHVVASIQEFLLSRAGAIS